MEKIPLSEKFVFLMNAKIGRASSIVMTENNSVQKITLSNSICIEFFSPPFSTFQFTRNIFCHFLSLHTLFGKQTRQQLSLPIANQSRVFLRSKPFQRCSGVHVTITYKSISAGDTFLVQQKSNGFSLQTISQCYSEDLAQIWKKAIVVTTYS